MSRWSGQVMSLLIALVIVRVVNNLKLANTWSATYQFYAALYNQNPPGSDLPPIDQTIKGQHLIKFLDHIFPETHNIDPCFYAQFMRLLACHFRGSVEI